MQREDEQRLRIELIETQIARLRQEMKMESRKFALSIVLAIVAAIGVIIALTIEQRGADKAEKAGEILGVGPEIIALME